MVKGPIGLCGDLCEVFIPNSPVDFYTSFLTTHFGSVTGRSLVKIAQMVELIRYQLSAVVVLQQVAPRYSSNGKFILPLVGDACAIRASS